MNNSNIFRAFEFIIYRSMILLEVIEITTKQFHFFVLVFNEFQVLKYVLLIFDEAQGNKDPFINVLIYIARPGFYLNLYFEDIYQWTIFFFLQFFLLIWICFVFIQRFTSKQNYTQSIQQFQISSTFNFVFLQLWKCFYILLTDFLGFQIIEGFLNNIVIYSQNNPIPIIISAVVITEIIVIILFQEIFFSISSHYIPKQLNFQIQSTFLSLLEKLLKIIIMCIFFNTNKFAKYIVVILSIIYGILEIYIQFFIRVKLDNKILQISSFMQCLIISVSLQQFCNLLTNEDFRDSKYISQLKLQFLWVVICVLFQYSIVQMLHQQNFEQLVQRTNNIKDIITLKLKLFTYQQLILNNNSQYKIINYCLLYNHRLECNQLNCLCYNSEMIMIKLEHIIIKEIIQNFRVILQRSQIQSSYVYMQFIQVLILYGKCFEALGWTQKILHQLNPQKFLQRKFQFIRGQISIQHKNLYKLIYQQNLFNIKYAIQQRTLESKINTNIQQAISSLQQKINTQKSIQNQFEDILINKIQHLEKLQNHGYQNSSVLDQNTHKLINKIESLKEILRYNFKQIPSFNNQCLLLFYQVEILNDLINSQTISQMNSQMIDIDNKNDANTMIDFFQQEFHCYTFALMDDENIIIQPNLNQYQKLQQLKYTKFEEMLPNSLQNVHKFYVRDFFQNGKNRFYLNINNSFLQISQGIIQQIELCMNVQFDLQQNRLLSLVFIKIPKKKSQLSNYIILDECFRIKEMTSKIYEKFLNKYLNNKQMFLDQKIYQFIPKLNESHFNEEKYIGIFELPFIKYDQCVSSSYLKSSCKLSGKIFGTLKVLIRKIRYKYTYYILEISEIKSDRKELETNYEFPQTDFDEKEYINIPNETQIQQDINEILSNQQLQQLTSRFDAQVPLLNTISVDKDNNTRHQILPNILENQISDSNFKIQVKNYQEQNVEDHGSQISSVAAIKKSLYYKQFHTINQLIFSKEFPNNIKNFNYYYIIFILIAMLNLILLVDQTQQLNIYQSLLSLLSIKYDIYEPIQSFLNTRYTIVSLNQAIFTNIINQTQYNELTAFPKSNLKRGYDDLKDNILDVLTRSEFQSFLKNKYFESYWSETTTKSVTKNITFRTGILALLEYQYDFKLAYTIRPIQTDAPYFFYSYENYISLINIFTDLSKDILEQLTTKLENQSTTLVLITVPLTILSVFLTLVYSYFLVAQRKIKNKLLSLSFQQDQESFSSEIKRLHQIKQLLYGDENYFYRYQLDINVYDIQLQSQEKEYTKSINKTNNKQVNNKIQNKSISILNFIQLSIIIINLVLIQTIYSVTLDQFNSYLRKSSNTAKIYENLSSVGVDILIIYSEREVLYRRANILFFQQSDYNDLLNLIDQSLIAIKSFTEKLNSINQIDYLLDDKSMSLFNEINKNSLCNYLPEEFQNYSKSLCPEVLSGSLNFGLLSTLNFMYNSIFSEKQINNFTYRNDNQVPIKELEGATFTAKVIKQLVQSLNKNISNFTNQIRINFSIIFIITICFEIIIGLAIMYKFSIYEKQQIDSLRKIVYLLPRSTLLFDDSFQRQLQNLIKIGKLI